MWRVVKVYSGNSFIILRCFVSGSDFHAQGSDVNEESLLIKSQVFLKKISEI